GAEVAVEAVLTRGRLRVLAVFDKPDPLDGPFFEETIYVTPSRHVASALAEIAGAAARAARALGLDHGPLHAELKWDGRRAAVVEIAPRSIGGLCSRALRFSDGASLESVLLRHALGDPLDGAEREGRALRTSRGWPARKPATKRRTQPYREILRSEVRGSRQHGGRPQLAGASMIQITDIAKQRITEYMQTENRPGLALRFGI